MRFVLFERGGQRFRSGTIPVPNGPVGSNITGIGAADALGWPGDDRVSRLRWAGESPRSAAGESPRSAAGAEEFRARARPQPSSQPAFPTSHGDWRQASALGDAPEGAREVRQDRQRRPKRRRVCEFEPRDVFGTMPATIIICGGHSPRQSNVLPVWQGHLLSIEAGAEP
jgi:hypothetical protein